MADRLHTALWQAPTKPHAQQKKFQQPSPAAHGIRPNWRQSTQFLGRLDRDARRTIDAILREAIRDPVGPEFMAPLARRFTEAA